MTTQQIIWTVVIVVAALALIGLIVASMRKKSQHGKEVRAAELRQEAQERAAVVPDAQVRAKEAEADAERARLEAQRADERAQAARTEVVQHEATVEDQVRAADRIDPRVDHRADDYAPDTTGVTGTHAAGRHESSTRVGDERGTTGDPDTIFDSRDGDTTSTGTTSTGSTSTGTHRSSDTDPDWTDPDQRDGTEGTTGGSHRA